MKKSLVLMLCAGFALPAMAQEGPSLPFGGELRLQPVGVPVPPGGYDDRAISEVYDCLTATFGNGSSTHLGASSMILEDVSFAPGPWASSLGRVITEVSVGVAILTTPAATEDFVVVFWDINDINYAGFGGTGTNMINPAATPLAVYRLAADGSAPGFYYQVTFPVSVAVPDGDSGVAVQSAWVNDAFVPTHWSDVSAGIYEGCASTTSRSTVFGSQTGAAVGGNPASPGSTTASYGRDISNATMCPNIGQMIGSAQVAAGNFEHRFINASPARGQMLRLRGDVVVPPPASTALGCIADAGLVHNDTATSGAVQWFNFCLAGNAMDAELKFFSLDTEGSATDMAMAIFNDGGALAGLNGQDEDSGSGTNAQLTYGVGRGAAVGDGQQYDGRSGQLAAGTYYVAVGPAGTTFAGGFTANASANAGGAYSMNFKTNTNGAALAPSVVPITTYDFDSIGGPIGAPDARPGLAQGTGLRGVVWHQFSTTFAAGAGDTFLDLEFPTLSTPTADGVAYLFDSAGEIVAFSDDEGAAALPLLSFGAGAGPRTYGAALESYSGQNGTLPAGQYYLAMALFATQDIELLGGNDRWHVRGTSGSNLTMGANLYTGGTPTAPCDGDVNCDFALDGFDVETQEKAVGGDLTDYCQPDPDFNGDFALDGFDVEAVEIVTGGGPCP